MAALDPHPDPHHDEGEVPLPDGRRLGWASFGDPDGEAVLWFHGTPGGRYQVPVGTNLAGRANGFRVITVERPGTGRSCNHHHRSVRHFAGDVEAAADGLGIDRFAVAGLSGGGPYTLAVAHELDGRVVTSAVLGGLAPSVGPSAVFSYTQLTTVAQALLTPLRRALGPLMRFGLDGVAAQAPGIYEAYAKVNGRADLDIMMRPDVMAMFLHDITQAGPLRAPLHDLTLFGRPWGFDPAKITSPVLLWHGDADHIVPLVHGKRLAKSIPNSRLTLMPGKGHFGGFAEVDDVLGTIRAVWDGTDTVIGHQRHHPEGSAT
ncbi:MAG: alpha/beta hydrolase [Microthrixaceae bacterium]